MEPLQKKDYEEPRCLLCDPLTGLPQKSNSILLARIFEKYDEYCGRKDFSGAERHLLYWIEEAGQTGDDRGAFSLLNEAMGFYRKQGQGQKAVQYANKAESLIGPLGFENTESAATCYINEGTVYHQFGMGQEAIGYFSKALQIMEGMEKPDAFKLGSLYNNMALAFTSLSRFGQAFESYRKALSVMEKLPGTEPEQAITWLNMADACSMEKGLFEAEEEIASFLEHAKSLLDAPGVLKNSYYAYVCEKCAPGFYCFGMPEFGQELENRAAQIYQEEMK